MLRVHADNDQDLAEVKRLHDEWWEANRDLDIERKRACFVEGEGFLQYNLNGHTYWSLDELSQLWAAIRDTYAIPDYEVIDLRIEIRGDMAWVSHEAKVGIKPRPGKELPPHIPAQVRVRETEVLIRDDGKGNPIWKIWHHHSSAHAPDDAVRDGFEESLITSGRA